MINHSTARAKLAQILGDQLPNVTVQRAGIDSLAVFPTVIVGQPTWDPGDGNGRPYGFDQSRFPIAVVVQRSSADSQVVDQLEDLWPQVIGVLRKAIETDPTLAGVCGDSHVESARFGSFALQGQSYPTQLIFVDLFG